MIKVIVGFKKKKSANIEPVLMKLRSNAMTYPGLVSTESLVKQEDDSIVVFSNVWDNTNSWKKWYESKLSQSLFNEIEPLLEEKPRVNIYHIIPEADWTQ